MVREINEDTALKPFVPPADLRILPRWVPKKEREEYKRREAEREEREKEMANKREEQRRKLVAAQRKGGIDLLPPRPDKKPGERMTAEEINTEAQYMKYFGPRKDQSTFVPKRERRNRKEVRFGWDDMDDTTLPNPELDAALERTEFLKRPTPQVDLPRKYDEEGEQTALKHADFMMRRLPGGDEGREKAIEYMDNWYKEREKGIRELERQNKRNLPWSRKALADMTDQDWQSFKTRHEITMAGLHLPHPIRHWSEANLPIQVLRTLEEYNLKEPMPIQRAAIPVAIHGKDIMGRAKTGSGKTLAFVIPLVVAISKLPAILPEDVDDGPYALILAPTRELAQQIEGEARKFAKPFNFSVLSIIGGRPIEEQGVALRTGAHIIVATPGRLKDCLERRYLVLERCRFLVMDEADRMIDMGFDEPLTYILESMPIKTKQADYADELDGMTGHNGHHDSYPDYGKVYRQTMMFSATMPTPLERMAEKYLRKPVKIAIGSVGEAVDTVVQKTERIESEKKRIARLESILSDPSTVMPVLIFVNTKFNVEHIGGIVKKMGFSTATLHGNKSQPQREAALASLREKKIDVLVATDVAARGLDIDTLPMVINFHMSRDIQAYTHRIGRTGRAGQRGVAITFWGSDDTEVLGELKNIISRSAESKVSDDLEKAAVEHAHKRRRMN